MFVARGDLVKGQMLLRQGRETDPPDSHQYKATGMSKVISSDWLRRHKDFIHGRPAIMEFRNLHDIDAGTYTFKFVRSLFTMQC